MKKEIKVIIVGVFASLLVIFGICAVTIHQSQLSGMPRETHSADISTSQFIKQVAPAAQREQKRYQIPASITIAQAGLESEWGRSKLGYKYNNLFGMKATKGDERVRMYTIENINGHKRYLPAYFAVYESWADSIDAHTDLIINGTHDDHARFKSVRTGTDYETAARELQRHGYATDPDYANKLVYAIKKFNLAQYDH
ncbi:mannosyl-glycoprotein endo-beta-N-acetylglucosamidase [Limosilactobacillus frumenti DSM 13145]|uniref:Mannosyl-glycoprotein endo-beta-N-acetylglucosamidase n=1 Tax=Limosilactobacillus frumenti DSM 13145 TaxID=1423746 RepID=A0A0R1P5V5_9LACO|nr:glycoside hydrolase family 73 protein [Limosilactobacillus frumenti]KRL27959.1 mannosyl-glycoprotein endo-beta-N-acetylglucosamidase [Limosilactobacillus frumenti DSM 13145]MBA2913547.1 glycoside hydrolase family 73 protein [Limosilactobacillus frumenti]QFG73205.1 mannosyl-glycoprotein endo-beta-N-acetylglucosamidase [Limosilactobacillus frumenti]